MVPEAGLEPARTKVRGILSPLCLPIPPLRHAIFGGDTRIRTGDKGFADLCLTAWLCRLNSSGAGNGTRTRDINLGKVALYQLSYSRKDIFFRLKISPQIFCQAQNSDSLNTSASNLKS